MELRMREARATKDIDLAFADPRNVIQSDSGIDERLREELLNDLRWRPGRYSKDKAAENIFHHIKPDEAQDKNGKVFKEKQEWPLPDYWMDTSVSERLWSVTESLIKGRIH